MKAMYSRLAVAVWVAALVGMLPSRSRAEEPAATLQAGVDNLVKQVGESMEKESLTKIAILDLVDLNHGVSALGRYVAERSITAFHRSKKFTVIERDLLERTLKKLNLTVADLADPGNVQLLGRALSIQGLVKGSISDLGATVEFNMRLVRAIEDAGSVVAVAQVTVKKDAETAKLLGQALPPSPVTGIPVGGSPTPGGDFALDLGEGVSLDLVWIQEKGLYVGKFEVTQQQWEKIMGGNPSATQKGPRMPVTGVSWEDACRFLSKLNELQADRMPEGYSARLPTAAEWEFCCRAGTQTEYSFGDDPLKLGLYAWYDNNSDGKPHEVGTKRPNPWGLYDMHGNVWEWCSDTVNQTARACRGGSWGYGAGGCGSACRGSSGPTSRDGDLGFRVVVAR